MQIFCLHYIVTLSLVINKNNCNYITQLNDTLPKANGSNITMEYFLVYRRDCRHTLCYCPALCLLVRLVT